MVGGDNKGENAAAASGAENQITIYLTVAPGIAEEYRKNCSLRPEIILNAPEYVDAAPSPLESGKIRLIHHGKAGPSRSLELMIHSMRWADRRIELNLMLVPGSQARYLDRLKKMAGRDSRIRFLEPVPMPAIAERIRAFDVGVCLFPPDNFNLTHALPNKFFEFVQARLALVIGLSSEMAPIVRRYDLGLATEDFSARALANSVNSLTQSALLYNKEKYHLAASDLSSNSEIDKLRRIVQEMFL